MNFKIHCNGDTSKINKRGILTFGLQLRRLYSMTSPFRVPQNSLSPTQANVSANVFLPVGISYNTFY